MVLGNKAFFIQHWAHMWISSQSTCVPRRVWLQHYKTNINTWSLSFQEVTNIFISLSDFLLIYTNVFFTGAFLSSGAFSGLHVVIWWSCHDLLSVCYLNTAYTHAQQSVRGHNMKLLVAWNFLFFIFKGTSSQFITFLLQYITTFS